MTAVFSHRRSGSSFSGFTITTIDTDATSAQLTVAGRLDAEAAAVLHAFAGSQLQAGRRFLRVDLHRVDRFTDDALPALSAVHRMLLLERGTLILTGLGRSIAARLSELAPELLWLAATAEHYRADRQVTSRTVNAADHPSLVASSMEACHS